MTMLEMAAAILFLPASMLVVSACVLYMNRRTTREASRASEQLRAGLR